MSKRERRLTPEETGMIRGLWEQGAMSLTEIAHEIGVSADKVKYQIKKHGWVQGARAEYYEEIALKAIEEQLETEAKKHAVAKQQARDKAVQLSNVVEGRLVKAMKEADSKGLSDAAMLHDYRALETASKILQNTFHTKRFALGMDKEEGPAEDENMSIQLAEMTADEVESIKQAQEEAWNQLGPDED